MDAIQGACLTIKLKHLERGNERRRAHAARYTAAFSAVEEIVAPFEAESARHVYHDVEGSVGLRRCLRLASLESELGFRSCFNFVPAGEYVVPTELREELTSQGFEIGVHDLHHVSWLDPQKVRKMIVVGSRKMVVYDDVADNKIAIYDKGIDRKAVLGENMDFDNPQRAQFNYRSGDIVLPEIKFREPLRVEAEHFLECVRTGQTPLTGLQHARNVVSVLERARPINVNGEVATVR